MLAPKLLGLAISIGKNASGDDFGCGYAFTEMPIASIWPAHVRAPPLFLSMAYFVFRTIPNTAA